MRDDLLPCPLLAHRTNQTAVGCRGEAVAAAEDPARIDCGEFAIQRGKSLADMIQTSVERRLQSPTEVIRLRALLNPPPHRTMQSIGKDGHMLVTSRHQRSRLEPGQPGGKLLKAALPRGS